ncbi:hypothetical protein OIU78_024216 [Salix suchowensis]|nr:hypothetical protein OIU78_024216 [Salix suchowensis]
MAYSADGTSCRVFLCGTNKEGESHLVEWNESEGAVKRNYNGLAKRSEGDLKLIPLTIDSWRLGMSSRSSFFLVLDFNKEGSLLVVSTKDNGIKILANSDGIRLLRTVESRAFDDPRASVIPYGVKLNDANHSLQSQLVEIFVAGLGKFNNLLSRFIQEHIMIGTWKKLQVNPLSSFYIFT